MKERLGSFMQSSDFRTMSMNSPRRLDSTASILELIKHSMRISSSPRPSLIVSIYGSLISQSLAKFIGPHSENFRRNYGDDFETKQNRDHMQPIARTMAEHFLRHSKGVTIYLVFCIHLSSFLCLDHGF